MARDDGRGSGVEVDEACHARNRRGHRRVRRGSGQPQELRACSIENGNDRLDCVSAGKGANRPHPCRDTPVPCAVLGFRRAPSPLPLALFGRMAEQSGCFFFRLCRSPSWSVHRICKIGKAAVVPV
eukprot:scaffold207_cov345-Pavlova_lutheri.AAC.17